MAYDIGGQVWACARIKWEAQINVSVVLGTGTTAEWRPVIITFKLHTTLVMQLGDDGSITAAEVSARSQAFDVRAQLAF